MLARCRWWIGVAALSGTVSCTRDGPPPRTLQIAVPNAVRGLQPAYSLDIAEGTVSGLVFESLVDRDSLDRAMPWLATRWTSPDSITWTFTLRSGVRFHDGSPFRAVDVIRAWTTLLTAGGGADEPPSVFMLIRGAKDVRSKKATAVDGLRAIDDTTLQLVLERSEPELPRTLGSRRLGILGAASTLSAPVGTGPWRYVGHSSDSTLYRFARWETYWHGRAKIESVYVRVLRNENLVQALLDGLIDCMGDAPERLDPRIMASRALRVIPQPKLTRGRLLVSMQNPALHDARVRRALLLAIDRPTIVRLLAARNVEISDGLVPQSVWRGMNTTVTPHAPDSARALLRAAGFTAETPLTIRLLGPAPSQALHALYGVLHDSWSAVGIRIVSIPMTDSENPVKGPRPDVEMWLEEPGVSTMEEYVNSVAIETPFGYPEPAMQWRNAAFSQLYSDARITTDTATREKLRSAMDLMLRDSLPSIPLFFIGGVVIESQRVNECNDRMPRFATAQLSAAP
jgi:peptide/nickel transport system substrate-binding protein